GTVTELARILALTTPTAAQTAALQRCLDAAAWEIDAYLDRTTPLTAAELPVVTEVNYERAAEHWKSEQSPFGIIVSGDTAPSYSSLNRWKRHANTLLFLK